MAALQRLWLNRPIRSQHVEEAMAKPDDSSWTTDHQFSVLRQTESRPGPFTDTGDRWMERRPTGNVIAVCSCGYYSGPVPPLQLDSIADLAVEHHDPMGSLLP